MRRNTALPPNAVCCRCGEWASAALAVREDGQVVCRNCGDTSHPRRPCTICARDLPAELHHVASRVVYPRFTVWLCRNCHQVLYVWQYQWRRDGRAERHPLRYVFVGVADILRLFAERSPAWQAVRPLFTMLLHAAMLVVGALRFEALAEVGHALTAIEGIL
jgi:hypothetical protein